MKANPSSSETVAVQSLTELDALIGRFVTSVSPTVYWEDTSTQWRFETLPEALAAMRDPFFTSFASEQDRSRSSLREIHDFPACSAELELAMAVVEQLSSEAKPLTLWKSGGCWSAAFPGGKSVEAATPALAICLAALRTRGIEIALDDELLSASVNSTLRMGAAFGEGSSRL